MKKLFITSILFLLCASVFAQEESVRIPDGYQGFFEQENRYHFWGEEDNSFSLSTTHGFYFNGHTFVGFGLGITGADNHAVLPLYTSVKHVFLNSTVVSPVLSARLGSYIAQKVGSYADVMLGVRFATKRDFALTIAVAVSYYEPYKDSYYDDEKETNVDDANIDFTGASLRFGIEW